MENPVNFYTFRDILSCQILAYDPKYQRCPGDGKMRVVTQMNQKYCQQRQSGRLVSGERGAKVISLECYRASCRTKQFCFNLPSHEKHLYELQITKHAVKCFVSSEQCYKRCNICRVTLYHFDRKGAGHTKNCFLQYHSNNYYSLCFGDCLLVSTTASGWSVGEARTTSKITPNLGL